MEPFRALLRSKCKPFYWDDVLDSIFQRSKDEIVKLISEGVRAYDLEKPTCLSTDWCKDGVGYSLFQKHCKCSGLPDPNCGNGHWKLVFAGSKATTESQSHYSPTEGECLAATYGLRRCRMYTLGCPNLILATDHNPLTGILNDRCLDSIDNPRLLSLKEKTLPYNFRIIYVKGGSLAIRTADCMSRYAIESDESDPDFDEIEQTARAHATFKTESSVSWQQINEVAATETNACHLSCSFQ